MKNLSGFLAGLLFGMGLVVAGMTDPEKVLAFLTVGAQWNPSLIYVLGSAVVTASIGFAWVNRRMAPLFDESFHSPSSFVVDKRLLAGSVLFGLGWGTAGYCPGPALVGGDDFRSPSGFIPHCVHRRCFDLRTMVFTNL